MRHISILLAILGGGAAWTVHLCSSSGSSRPGLGTLTGGDPDPAQEAPGISPAGTHFDGWCVYSVALGRHHRPQDVTLLEHDGLTYHLCGEGNSDGCNATAMWRNCGELLRADADRQWRLLRRR